MMGVKTILSVLLVACGMLTELHAQDYSDTLLASKNNRNRTIP